MKNMFSSWGNTASYEVPPFGVSISYQNQSSILGDTVKLVPSVSRADWALSKVLYGEQQNKYALFIWITLFQVIIIFGSWPCSSQLTNVGHRWQRILNVIVELKKKKAEEFKKIKTILHIYSIFVHDVHLFHQRIPLIQFVGQHKCLDNCVPI